MHMIPCCACSAGADHRCQMDNGGVHPGRVARSSQGHRQPFTLTPTENVERPLNLSMPLEVGGSRNMQTQGERANSTQTDHVGLMYSYKQYRFLKIQQFLLASFLKGRPPFQTRQKRIKHQQYLFFTGRPES